MTSARAEAAVASPVRTKDRQKDQVRTKHEARSTKHEARSTKHEARSTKDHGLALHIQRRKIASTFPFRKHTIRIRACPRFRLSLYSAHDSVGAPRILITSAFDMPSTTPRDLQAP